MRRVLVLLALAFPASAQAAQPAKVLQRLDGTLSAPASGAPEDVALRYVRANLSRLGLDRDDLGTLQAPTTTTAGAFTPEKTAASNTQPAASRKPSRRWASTG